MNKKTFKSLLIIVLLLFCVMISNAVYAAGTFSISKSSATIIEGKTTTFSINGSNATGRVDIKSSDTSVATVSSSSEWLENSSKTITVTAKKAGTATITINGTVSDENGAEAEITKTIKITVKAKETTNNTTDTNKNTETTTNKDTTTEKPKEKSNNAYLSTLGVTPKEYDFTGFKKGTTSYSVTVPSNVDSLKVLYKTADSNATVKVTGNSGFEVGSDNKITIKVTAEDGKTTKTYTIKVTKLAEEEEKPGNVIEDEEGIYLTSLELDGLEISPEFAKETYSYTATLEDTNATEVKVKAKANKEKANIAISGNTDLTEGENTINIIVTLEDSEEQKVYQVILTKATKMVAGANTENNNSENGGTLTDLISNLKKYIIIAAIVVVLMVIGVIVLIILLRRENKAIDEKDKREDNIEEYNVYKNDANEFDNKKSEADNFIESLYRQRNGNLYNEEELDLEEKQTLEEINRETDKIFRDKVEGQSIEYILEEFEEEKRPKRKSKGKHSK